MSCWPFNYKVACGWGAAYTMGFACEPCDTTGCFLRRVPVAPLHGGPRVLAAEFIAAEDLLIDSWGSCTGDVLTMTFGAAVVGEPKRSDFDVSVSSRMESLDQCWRYMLDVQPDCVLLNPGLEENERNTVTLIGNFTGAVSRFTSPPDDANSMPSVSPNSVAIHSLALQATAHASGSLQTFDLSNSTYHAYDCIDDWCAPHFNWRQGFRLLDAKHLNLSEPLNTASADPNGCAALHPSATHAIRLTFSSAVYEYGAGGSLVPYGTHVTPEAASSTFRLIRPWSDSCPDCDSDSDWCAYTLRDHLLSDNSDADMADVLSPDSVSDESSLHKLLREQELSGYAFESRDVPSSAEVLGVADADGDNVVDVCVRGAADATAIWLLCDHANMVDASGHVCVSVDGPDTYRYEGHFEYTTSSPVRMNMVPQYDAAGVTYCSGRHRDYHDYTPSDYGTDYGGGDDHDHTPPDYGPDDSGGGNTPSPHDDDDGGDQGGSPHGPQHASNAWRWLVFVGIVEAMACLSVVVLVLVWARKRAQRDGSVSGHGEMNELLVPGS